jgi:hypothetical protein
MHLSRRRTFILLTEHTLRPGDGNRYAFKEGLCQL